MAFIGRDDDLKQLQECFTERRAQLVFVYGRRRVGKTETLIQLAKDKETLFFAAQNATKDEQLASFSRLMFEAGAPGKDYLSQYPSWERALTELTRLPEPSDGGRRLVIFDEFPYLVRSVIAVSATESLGPHVASCKSDDCDLRQCHELHRKGAVGRKIAAIWSCDRHPEDAADAILGCSAILPQL